MSSQISQVAPISVSTLKRIPVDLQQARQLDASAFATLARAPQPVQPLAPAPTPPDKDYANVRVGGRIVATLSNNGYATTPNGIAGLRDIFEDDKGLTGPALAQSRADRIAERLGGTVEKAGTALTQSQWQQLQRNWQSGAADTQAAARTTASTQRAAYVPNPSDLLFLQGG